VLRERRRRKGEGIVKREIKAFKIVIGFILIKYIFYYTRTSDTFFGQERATIITAIRVVSRQ